MSLDVASSEVVSHQLWDELVSKYVNRTGAVNYLGMKTDEAKLQSYLHLLSQNPPSENWTRNEQIAYWINSYNSYTIQIILKNLPVKSIRDIDNGKVWDEVFIPVGSKKYSLNNIEHDILRKQFSDPRIHFALNCASASCPKLLNAAYNATDLDKQLATQAKEFVNDPSKNKIATDKLQLSSIFDWYKEDFTKKGTLIDFLNQYSSVKISSTATISFLNYDWSLND